jgi:hypothetical protein
MREEKKREKLRTVAHDENQLSVICNQKQKTFKGFADEHWGLLTVEWLRRWGVGKQVRSWESWVRRKRTRVRYWHQIYPLVLKMAMSMLVPAGFF